MIQARKISKSYGMKTLFNEVSFHVTGKDKVGLIAPNGSGKTTLLKILLGIEEPDRGSIVREGEVLGYLPQVLAAKVDDTIQSFLETKIEEEWEQYRIDMALAQVGLAEIDRTVLLSTLSGGQKTRVGLAHVLLSEPTTLLLDEPTNNLDIESLLWLETFIKDFSGAVIIISHDRAFLDATVSKIIEIDQQSKTVIEYTANYSGFTVLKAQRQVRELNLYKVQEKKRQEIETLIKELQSLLANKADPKAGRRLQAMKTRYQREFVDNALEKPMEMKRIRVASIGDDAIKKKVAYFIKDMSYGSLFSCKQMTIHARDRTHLVGQNGAGKSTFIKLLLGQLSPTTGLLERGEGIRVGYFAQEHEMLDYDRSVIDNYMTGVENYHEQTARSVLAQFLFTSQVIFNPVSSLSPGERVKLIIAILTHQNNQFLILDEPTNHLDIESREVLETALNSFEGGLLVVSHDRYFVQKLALDKKITIQAKLLQISVMENYHS